MNTFKKALAVFLAAIMALCAMSVSAFAEGEDDAVVVEGELVSFVGITVAAPIAGYNADGTYDLDSEEYELTDLMWTDADTEEILFSTNEDTEVVDKVFEEGSVYTVTVALYAADGYVFELDAEELIVSVNGYVAEVEEISEAGKLLVVSCDFECTGEDVDIGDDDSTSVTFDQILNLLKTVLVTIIRFFGTLLGIG